MMLIKFWEKGKFNVFASTLNRTCCFVYIDFCNDN